MIAALDGGADDRRQSRRRELLYRRHLALCCAGCRRAERGSTSGVSSGDVRLKPVVDEVLPLA